ncbi:MAG: sulfite reductase [Ahrensia sp.]|nr:sulfite reductase [Ahrensia sp.]|tara:strand:+ start:28517 stop:28819 length:303 start_codon:yes stop_codon:yes gene_type:complete
MAREYRPRIVTANDLIEGDAVYFTASHGWSREHGEAVVAFSADAADGLLEAAAKQQDRIVGVYLAEVEMGPDHRPQPVHFREAFRTRGPSNYFHGKQAQA